MLLQTIFELLLFVSMADWNNEMDSIARECELRTLSQPGVNGTKQAGEQRQGKQ
jgi:hypothetical protein